MKTLCIFVCASLLTGCTSASVLQSPFAGQQEFGYPQVRSLPLPSPAPELNEPASAAVASAAVSETSIQARPTVDAGETSAAPYDETKDPVMRDLLAQVTRPVEEDLHMSDGKLVLPPAAKLDIIDIRDVSGALQSGAGPSS